jgi:hypothetical protein
MKSQEQRIGDATAAFLGYTKGWHRGNFDSSKVSEHHWRAAITDALEAADREPPKWPTDESVFAINKCRRSGAHIEDVRNATREAMLADPIVKAAIALRDEIVLAVGPVGLETARVVQAVIDAVNEAGL